MAKLLSGINGHLRGKVGTISGSSWRGIEYIKGPYKKRTGKAGQGEAGNRNKFAEAQYWLKPVVRFVREGFKGYAGPVQGFIAAKSHLLQHAFEGTAPDLHINPALVQVSYGTLPLPAAIAVEKIAAGQLAFSWGTEAVQDGHAKDQAMLLAYDVENGKAYFTTLGQFRDAGGDTLNTPSIPGRTYHIYFAFTAADRSRQSDSMYLGVVVM